MQRHEHLLEQFPALHTPRIQHQLRDIQAKLGDLAPPNEEEEAGERALVPKTTTAQRALLQERPAGWEYYLFAGVLAQQLAALERKSDEERLEIARGPRRPVPDADATEYLSTQMDVFGAIAVDGERVFQVEAQAEAFGKPGEAGDAARIEAFAVRIMKVYEEFLDWSADLRAAVPPEEYERLYEIASRWARRPAESFRRFVDDVGRQMEVLQAHLVADTGETLHMTLTATIETDPEVKAAMSAELERLREAL